MGLGRVHAATQRESEALPVFDKLAISAANARLRSEALFSAGMLELKKGQLNYASSSMNAAVASDTSYALAYTGRAMISFTTAISTSTLNPADRTTLTGSAFNDFEHAINLNPHQTLALFQFGISLASVGAMSNAKTVLEKAAAAAPSDITLTTTERTAFLQQIKSALSFASHHP